MLNIFFKRKEEEEMGTEMLRRACLPVDVKAENCEIAKTNLFERKSKYFLRMLIF